MSKKGSLSCHTCFDTEPRFLWFHLKEQTFTASKVYRKPIHREMLYSLSTEIVHKKMCMLLTVFKIYSVLH